MNISEWTELRAITARVGDLKFRGTAAAASGDLTQASHFFRLAMKEEDDRERVLERLIGNVSIA